MKPIYNGEPLVHLDTHSKRYKRVLSDLSIVVLKFNNQILTYIDHRKAREQIELYIRYENLLEELNECVTALQDDMVAIGESVVEDINRAQSFYRRILNKDHKTSAETETPK